MADVDAQRMHRAVAEAPEWFGLPSAATEIGLIGHGETYDAWMVATGETRVVIRVVRRPVASMPRSMADEYLALAMAPAGVGPTPIALDLAGTRLEAPCMVMSHVPGVVSTDPTNWTEPVLTAYAAQLAILHATPYDGCGALRDPPKRRSPRLSITHTCRDALAWWAANHPWVLDVAEVRRRIPAVERYMATREWAFAGLTRFAFIHADTIAANILLHEGLPRLVDWEWAQIGDPAQDLGMIGGAVPTPGFSVPLTPAARTHLVTEYLRLTVDQLGGQGDDKASLTARTQAWEINERFFTDLHYRTVLAAGTDPDGRYTRAIADVDRYLPDVLAGGPGWAS